MPKKKPNAKRFVLTEQANAIDYLEKASDFLQRVKRDQWAWKWIAIALHGSLYSFAVCVLGGTNPDRVTRQTKRGRRLIDFNEAIRRCQSEPGLYTISKPLQLTPQQKGSIKYLQTIRNQIEHYAPMLWVITEHDLAVAAVDVVAVIHFLALKSNNMHFNNLHEQRQVRAYTAKIKKLLQESQPYKDFLSSSKQLRKKPVAG